MLTPKPEMKCLCLQAMAIVYGSYHEDIGPFSDTKHIVQMLDRVSIYFDHLKHIKSLTSCTPVVYVSYSCSVWTEQKEIALSFSLEN